MFPAQESDINHRAALWELMQTLSACSVEAFSSIPDDSKGLSWRL